MTFLPSRDYTQVDNQQLSSKQERERERKNIRSTRNSVDICEEDISLCTRVALESD